MVMHGMFKKKGLLTGADVVIATPGRLLSHINLYDIDFSGVKYFVLDEADRMLDMGFYDDIMKIEGLLPKNRQTVMFSATMPKKIRQLAKTILHNPVEIFHCHFATSRNHCPIGLYLL